MFSTRVVHSGGRGQGFIAEIAEAEGWLFASGGTYHRTTFLRSSDGETFEKTAVPDASGLRGLCVRSADEIVVVGEYGMIATTRDRGDTWELADSPVNHCVYRVIDAMGAMWAVCDSGVLRSDDGGATWERALRSARMLIATHAQRKCFFYGDGMHVWDGSTFREIDLAREAPLTGLVEASDGALVLIGDGGQVFCSDDGESWTRVRTPTGADLEDVAVVPNGIVVVGAKGTVMFSELGRNWEIVDIGRAKDHLWSALAVDGGLVVGCQGGKILRLDHDASTEWEDLD